MKKQTRKYCVRNFGNDREYDSIDELLSGLRTHYAGVSIAVHVRSGRGMLHPLFIDVATDGELYETYGSAARARVTREVIEAVGRSSSGGCA